MIQPRRLFASWPYRRSNRGTESAGKRRRLLKPASLESLESRCLLSTTITEYPALSSGTNASPTQLVVGPDSNIWFTEPTGDEIGVFNPSSTSDTVTHQIGTTAGNADPPGITATSGANAAVFFTMNAVGEVGELKSASSSPVIHFLSPPYYSSAGITSLGSNVWFTLPSGNEIAEYSAVTLITPYLLSGANITGFNSQITAGPDGNLWFTEDGGIGVFSPTSDSVIAQISLPTAGGTQVPSAITPGPGNTIWFTESVPGTGATAVGVISTTTDQLITEIAAPTGSNPQGITEGPDGNMWFTESGAGKIGMIDVNSLTDPAQDSFGGQSFSIPIEGQTGGVLNNPDPQGIISGPDSSLWFADSSAQSAR